MSTALRIFAALPVPDMIAARVAPLQKGVPGAKWRPRDNLHVTLAFYGETELDRIEELDAALARIRIAPFELRLKGAGHFGSSEPRALWLGVEGGEPLADLARQCAQAGKRAGIEMERRVYMPHLTLAYLTSPDLVRLQRFEQRLNLHVSEPFIADRFALYSSMRKRKGPNQYLAEAEYPLEGR
jgi:2'-5' RNA ligase